MSSICFEGVGDEWSNNNYHRYSQGMDLLQTKTKRIVQLGDSISLPWTEIHEYLLEVGASGSREEFCRRAFHGIGRLIQYDVAAALFDTAARGIAGIGLDEETRLCYNQYYSARIPFTPRVYDVCRPSPFQRVCWRDHEDSEFVRDFAFPSGIFYSLVNFTPTCRLSLSLHRSRSGPGFSPRDSAILSVVDPHLNNLYRCFEKLSGAAALLSSEAIADRLRCLSKREAEILAHLAHGLTMPEIASRLFISVRTVETHVEHIYSKLSVRTRRQAIEKAIRYRE